MVCTDLLPGELRRKAMRRFPANTYFSQYLPAGWPAQPLGQSVEEPEPSEGRDGGAPGEDHVDQAHHQQAGGEEPAGAHLVGEDAANELADGIGRRLAAGDETCGGAEPEGHLSRGGRAPARPLAPAPGVRRGHSPSSSFPSGTSAMTAGMTKEKVLRLK